MHFNFMGVCLVASYTSRNTLGSKMDVLYTCCGWLSQYTKHKIFIFITLIFRNYLLLILCKQKWGSMSVCDREGLVQ